MSDKSSLSMNIFDGAISERQRHESLGLFSDSTLILGDFWGPFHEVAL